MCVAVTLLSGWQKAHRDSATGSLNLEKPQPANCHLLASLTSKRAVARNGSDLQMSTGGALTRLKYR